jgi:hypothetical protein
MKTSKILVEENRIVSVSIPVYFFKLKVKKIISS